MATKPRAETKRQALAHPALYWRDGSRYIWCRYSDERGRSQRKSTHRRDEKAAIAVWRQLERAAVGAADRVEVEAALTDGIARFIEHKTDQGRAKDTIDFYTDKARHLCSYFGKDLHVSKIDAIAVDAYVSHRKRAGASAHSIHKELVVLRGVLKVAARRGEFRGDPRAPLPIGFSTGYKPRTTAHTAEQFAAMLVHLSAARAAKLCFYVAVGPRRKELRRARRADIDFVTGFVHLRGTKTEQADRHVPITPLARPLLERALRDADGDPEDVEDAKLFAAWDSPYKALATACAKAGVPYVTPNDLRRTFATWLQEQNVSNEHLAKLLGHSSTAMVERVYGRARPEALRQHLASTVSDLYRTVADQRSSNGATGSAICEISSRAAGDRTPDQRIKSPVRTAVNSAEIPPERLAAVLDLDAVRRARESARVSRCGPPSLYRRVREPKTFGQLLDAALSVGGAG